MRDIARSLQKKVTAPLVMSDSVRKIIDLER